MLNLSKYKGINQFGLAYKVMLENDPHARGSVDRILIENMVRLCSETAKYLYAKYTPVRSFYKEGMRPKLEQYVEEAILGAKSIEERIEAIARFTSSLQEKACQDLEAFQIGGTEEEIVARGSDWCPHIARVACALYQVAGFPARIVNLADTDKAYSGHVIIEVYRDKSWGTIDPLTNVVYRHLYGRPASTWDLMTNSNLIKHHFRDESTPYTTADQFRAAAISNYFVWKWKDYTYTVSKMNDYYRSILEMAERGWPGGLRWLHGEDR
ncbi:transglutaminase-like domain-containing protein [Candidatus Acetothermia bacterium]|jgi:hypothetical protein|nr:transglutaminase-like domain-containing protein [Candidatus Acetothermia bacterium]